MNDRQRAPLTAAEEQKVRFWVDTLLNGMNRSNAAHQLYSIGVRTRGAIRTRGSAQRPAPNRFPVGTPVHEIIELLRSEAEPGVRCAVASALGELGGHEALDVLHQLISDSDAGVRSSAADAIGIIGGPKAIEILGEIARNENDPVLKSMARGLIESLGQG